MLALFVGSQVLAGERGEEVKTGTVQMHVSIKVDAAELAEWRPDRTAAFFEGIAKVLEAAERTERNKASGRKR